MGTEQALLTIRQNRGTNGSLGCQNFTIKGGVGYKEKGQIFGRKNHQQSIVKKEKTEGNLITLSSRYPVKATIAHIRIQKESNFASLED